jgi:heme/copper-type cytochrome/quinol oxidase subunit 2
MTSRRAWTGLPLALGIALAPAAVPAPPVAAQAPAEVKLTMQKDRFEPAELRVKANRPFVLVLTNRDDISHELDIPKLKLEKKVRAGQTIRLPIPALKPGRYELVDDDATPSLAGAMIAE